MNRPSARIISIQRWSIGLLVAGGALNYIDRATLSVANKLIQDDLGIPVAKMGLLLSAFLWAYAIAQLPVGGLIDRYGPRRLLGLGLFSWSIAQAAGGLVNSFGVFILARFAYSATQPLLSTNAVTLFPLEGQNNLDQIDFLLYNAGTSPLDWIVTNVEPTIKVSPA